MAPKRPRDITSDESQSKKPRTAFHIGPDNLPDGTWKRKVLKIKKNLIHKAKVKKNYRKLKAREPLVEKPIPEETLGDVPAMSPTRAQLSQELHPDRQAMLDAPEEPIPPPSRVQARGLHRKHPRKPAYFERETAVAQQRRAEAEARKIELEARDRERKQKMAERERYRNAMAKARTGGKNGQRKLGRESKILLEKVRRVVAS